AVPQARRLVTRRGALRVACVMAAAALVNAWYLLPALVYGRRTNIVQTYGFAHTLHRYDYLVAARRLFTLSRDTSAAAGPPAFSTALPVLAIALVLAGLVVSPTCGRAGGWRRALWIFAAAATAVGLVMTHPALILALPSPYAVAQFGFRLETWVLLSISAAVLAVLVLARESPRLRRPFSWATAVVVIASVVGAVQQVGEYPRSAPRSPVSADFRHAYPKAPGGGEMIDYDDASLPPVQAAEGPELVFPAASVHDDRVAVSADLPAGRLVRSNLATGPYLVTVTGASVAGRTANGHMVLRVDAARTAGGQRISLRPADSRPVVYGRLISSLALLLLGLGLGLLLVNELRGAGGRAT
ncbi:MAG TPA: hypothetical protein VN892_13665, partial [Solirubrobacteraceae bacterium]|nr:hypothetical protein [Solirubrobacteraceae bacterium]